MKQAHARASRPATSGDHARDAAGRESIDDAEGHDAEDAGSGERLQKILAAAGIGSRRKCEELILTGRVEVDRRVVTHLGAKADPARQEIRLDGAALPRVRLVHYVVHKPPGVVSTNYDQAGRPRVVDLVPRRDNERLFAVGRLDLSSEGLMLLTNDGELANRLTHPRYGVEKTYLAEVAGAVDRNALASLRKGAHLAEGFARVASARVRTEWKKSTLLEIVLAEGRNREIRRLLAREGHKVLRLTRIALGPLRLGELPPGAWRPIEPSELRALRHAAFAGKEVKRRRRSKPAAQRPQVKAPLESGPTVIGGDREEPRPEAAKFARPKPGAAKSRPVKSRPMKSGARTSAPPRPRSAKAGVKTAGIKTARPKPARPTTSGPKTTGGRNSGAGRPGAKPARGAKGERRPAGVQGKRARNDRP